MRMLIGRNAAARTIRRRSPDEIARGSRCSGSFILRTSRRGRYSHPSANLQPERVGGAALVDGEAQSPVRVGDEHQFASPGGPEGLKVPDRHLTIPDVDPHGGAVLELGFLVGDGQAGVAVSVYGDDPGRDTVAGPSILDARQ